jgi:hypothetical protein
MSVSVRPMYYNMKFLLFYKGGSGYFPEDDEPHNSWVKLLVYYINFMYL